MNKKSKSNLNFDDLFGQINKVKPTRKQIERDVLVEVLIKDDPLFKEKDKKEQIDEKDLTGISEKNYGVFDKIDMYNIKKYDRYYSLTNILKNNIIIQKLYNITIGANPLLVFIIFMTSFIGTSIIKLESFHNLFYLGLLYSILSMMGFFILRAFIFSSEVNMNWISYMRYILKEKHNLTKKEINETTRVLIYENEGIHSSFVNEFMRSRRINKEWKIINWIKNAKL